jgi:hypothetical protein
VFLDFIPAFFVANSLLLNFHLRAAAPEPHPGWGSRRLGSLGVSPSGLIVLDYDESGALRIVGFSGFSYLVLHEARLVLPRLSTKKNYECE